MRKSVTMAAMLVGILVSSVSGQLTNVALQASGGTATADSWETYNGFVGSPDKAIDGQAGPPGPGSEETGWRGGSIPGWLQVQFNQPYEIQRVGIWFSSHQQTYSVSLSMDGSAWDTVIPSTLSTNYEGSPPSYASFDISPTVAEYIRMDITGTSAPGSHIFQTSINELEAYAIPEPSALSLLMIGVVALFFWHRTRPKNV